MTAFSSQARIRNCGSKLYYGKSTPQRRWWHVTAVAFRPPADLECSLAGSLAPVATATARGEMSGENIGAASRRQMIPNSSTSTDTMTPRSAMTLWIKGARFWRFRQNGGEIAGCAFYLCRRTLQQGTPRSRELDRCHRWAQPRESVP
jgi:hypothetical protein